MKPIQLTLAAVLVGAVAVLAACGGGGDPEAGSPTPLSTQPAEFTLSVPDSNPDNLPPGTCYSTLGASQGARFYVYGGAAPYRLDNTAPGYVQLDRSTVSDRGGYFEARLTGGCTEGSIVVVVDALDRQVTVTLNNVGAAASSP